MKFGVSKTNWGAPNPTDFLQWLIRIDDLAGVC